jgi:hypothetical protein
VLQIRSVLVKLTLQLINHAGQFAAPRNQTDRTRLFAASVTLRPFANIQPKSRF